MAINELQRINADEKMRRRMADREKEEFDLAIIKGAVYKRGKEDGKAEGKAEGRVEGVLETRRQIVLQMLAKGITLKEISEIAAIPVEDIQKFTDR